MGEGLKIEINEEENEDIISMECDIKKERIDEGKISKKGFEGWSCDIRNERIVKNGMEEDGKSEEIESGSERILLKLRLMNKKMGNEEIEGGIGEKEIKKERK